MSKFLSSLLYEAIQLGIKELDIAAYTLKARIEWLIFRNCMFASDSMATRHITMFIENPPERMLAAVKAVDITIGAATRVADCAFEILTSEVTH